MNKNVTFFISFICFVQINGYINGAATGPEPLRVDNNPLNSYKGPDAYLNSHDPKLLKKARKLAEMQEIDVAEHDRTLREIKATNSRRLNHALSQRCVVRSGPNFTRGSTYIPNGITDKVVSEIVVSKYLIQLKSAPKTNTNFTFGSDGVVCSLPDKPYTGTTEAFQILKNGQICSMADVNTDEPTPALLSALTKEDIASQDAINAALEVYWKSRKTQATTATDAADNDTATPEDIILPTPTTDQNSKEGANGRVCYIASKAKNPLMYTSTFNGVVTYVVGKEKVTKEKYEEIAKEITVSANNTVKPFDSDEMTAEAIASQDTVNADLESNWKLLQAQAANNDRFESYRAQAEKTLSAQAAKADNDQNGRS